MLARRAGVIPLVECPETVDSDVHYNIMVNNTLGMYGVVATRKPHLCPTAAGNNAVMIDPKVLQGILVAR